MWLRGDGLLESRRASYGADVQLVGTTVKKWNWLWLTFLWFIAVFFALAHSASVDFGKWARLVTSRSLDRLDRLVRSGNIYFFNVPPATDATTLGTALLQLQSSSAGNIQGQVQCIQKGSTWISVHQMCVFTCKRFPFWSTHRFVMLISARDFRRLAKFFFTALYLDTQFVADLSTP